MPKLQTRPARLVTVAGTHAACGQAVRTSPNLEAVGLVSTGCRLARVYKLSVHMYMTPSTFSCYFRGESATHGSARRPVTN